MAIREPTTLPPFRDDSTPHNTWWATEIVRQPPIRAAVNQSRESSSLVPVAKARVPQACGERLKVEKALAQVALQYDEQDVGQDPKAAGGEHHGQGALRPNADDHGGESQGHHEHGRFECQGTLPHAARRHASSGRRVNGGPRVQSWCRHAQDPLFHSSTRP